MKLTILLVAAVAVIALQQTHLARAKAVGGRNIEEQPAENEERSEEDPRSLLTYCKLTVKGEDYRGRQNITELGFTCQRWDSQEPHGHTVKDQDDSENYCRNPNDAKRPWCYTTSAKRWDWCDIPLCPEKNCKREENGASYRGWTSRTESGLECQRWDATAPYRPSPTVLSQVNTTLVASENFCRNPTVGTSGEREWCYTIDPDTRWEYCSVPLCEPERECRTTFTGEDYRGTLNVTKSGRPCQRWSLQTPYEHNGAYTEDDANYCRNRDGHTSAWCFTGDDDEPREECEVPLCPEVVGHPPTEGGCGQRPPIELNIVGGKPADANSWPWQVSLQSPSGRHFCGGSIVSKRWIVTAAHCVRNFWEETPISPDDILVVAGAYDLYKDGAEPTRQLIEVEEIHGHPGYTRTSFDVALLKLKNDLEFEDAVSPICLPGGTPAEDAPVGMSCAITGWGDTEGTEGPDEPHGDPLRVAYVPIIDNRQCSEWLNEVKPVELKEAVEVCAGHEQGGTDTCQGDSGGPLACQLNSEDEIYTLIGATSWGFGCGDERRPGVYARIAGLMDFVTFHTRGDYHVTSQPTS